MLEVRDKLRLWFGDRGFSRRGTIIFFCLFWLIIQVVFCQEFDLMLFTRRSGYIAQVCSTDRLFIQLEFFG